ncbi:hypothetical protein BGZ83_003495 [Gryganskiella cystojenkinii]|nr:hypothetical protein BGZ83_003495 [Gryganskiella cystojenkinii]
MGVKSVCGLAFPAKCKTDNTKLFKCKAGKPESPIDCPGGCMVTVRDHTCRDRRANIQKAIDQITPLKAAVTSAKAKNDLSGILFGELSGQLDRLKSELTKLKNEDDPTNFGITADYGQLM